MLTAPQSQQPLSPIPFPALREFQLSIYSRVIIGTIIGAIATIVIDTSMGYLYFVIAALVGAIIGAIFTAISFSPISDILPQFYAWLWWVVNLSMLFYPAYRYSTGATTSDFILNQVIPLMLLPCTLYSVANGPPRFQPFPIFWFLVPSCCLLIPLLTAAYYTVLAYYVHAVYAAGSPSSNSGLPIYLMAVSVQQAWPWLSFLDGIFRLARRKFYLTQGSTSSSSSTTVAAAAADTVAMELIALWQEALEMQKFFRCCQSSLSTLCLYCLGGFLGTLSDQVASYYYNRMDVVHNNSVREVGYVIPVVVAVGTVAFVNTHFARQLIKLRINSREKLRRLEIYERLVPKINILHVDMSADIVAKITVAALIPAVASGLSQYLLFIQRFTANS